MNRHFGAIAVATVNVAASSALAFAGLLVSSFRCDDHCSTTGNWSRDADAWQWTTITVLSLGVFASALALLVAVLVRRRKATWVVLSIWLLATVCLLALLDGSAYF